MIEYDSQTRYFLIAPVAAAVVEILLRDFGGKGIWGRVLDGVVALLALEPSGVLAELATS